MNLMYLLYPMLLCPAVWLYLGKYSGSNASARLRIRPPPAPRRSGSGRGRGLSFMAVDGQAIVNPFINETPLLTPYERAKMSFTLVYLVPIKLIIAIGALAGALLYLSLCTVGLSKEDLATKPLSSWRKAMRWPTKILTRIYLFALGHVWIKVKGSRASPAECSVIVPKHIAFLDPLYLGGCHLLSAVAGAANSNLPLIGRGLVALQCILVDRLDPNSRHKTVEEIKKRAAPGSPWGQFMIFPEGTTTSSNAVISFKVGAFLPGQPVQPCIIKYPFKHFDNCWVVEGPGLAALWLRQLCQFVSYMEVEWLPVYHPNAAEKADPARFARNVQRVMAKHMNVPSTDHSFSDVVLALKAQKRGLKVDAVANVQLEKLRSFLNVNVKTAQEYLEAFVSVDENKDGRLDLPAFAKAFGHGVTPQITRLFHLLDTDESGYIDFREYLLGLAVINEEGKAGRESALRLAYKVFDTEGTNGLTKQQLFGMLRRGLPDLTAEVFDELWAKADSDNDGVVSIDEFIRFAMQYEDKLPLFKKEFF